MKTISRLHFMVLANAVWLWQFVTEFLGPQLQDRLAWQQRQTAIGQIGCVGDTAVYAPADRLYLLGLVWLLSMPLMTLIAWKLPEVWPLRISRFWWNEAAGARSAATLAVALAIMLWPVWLALSVPVTSTVLLEVLRAFLLFGVLLYYRAILLSA